MNSVKKSIIKVTGRTGKTKGEIADAVGISYSHAAATVNELLYSGELQIKSTEGRKTIFCTPPRTSPPGTVIYAGRSVSGKLVTVTT